MSERSGAREARPALFQLQQLPEEKDNLNIDGRSSRQRCPCGLLGAGRGGRGRRRREEARDMEQGEEGLNQHTVGEPGWVPWAGKKDPPDPIALILMSNSCSSSLLLPHLLATASSHRDREEELIFPGLGAQIQLRASSAGHEPQHGIT